MISIRRVFLVGLYLFTIVVLGGSEHWWVVFFQIAFSVFCVWEVTKICRDVLEWRPTDDTEN